MTDFSDCLLVTQISVDHKIHTFSRFFFWMRNNRCVAGLFFFIYSLLRLTPDHSLLRLKTDHSWFLSIRSYEIKKIFKEKINIFIDEIIISTNSNACKRKNFSTDTNKMYTEQMRR